MSPDVRDRLTVVHTDLDGRTYRHGTSAGLEVGGLGKPPPTLRGRLAGRLLRGLAWPAAVVLMALALRVQLAGILPLALCLVAALPGAFVGLLALGDRVERPPHRYRLRPFVLRSTAQDPRARSADLGEETRAPLPARAALTTLRTGDDWGVGLAHRAALVEGLRGEIAQRLVTEVETQRARLSAHG
ncbi:MAG: hypothetical protein ACFCGT_22460 [Sandaracinaceae bacterium]